MSIESLISRLTPSGRDRALEARAAEDGRPWAAVERDLAFCLDVLAAPPGMVKGEDATRLDRARDSVDVSLPAMAAVPSGQPAPFWAALEAFRSGAHDTQAHDLVAASQTYAPVLTTGRRADLARRSGQGPHWAEGRRRLLSHPDTTVEDIRRLLKQAHEGEQCDLLLHPRLQTDRAAYEGVLSVVSYAWAFRGARLQSAMRDGPPLPSTEVFLAALGAMVLQDAAGAVSILTEYGPPFYPHLFVPNGIPGDLLSEEALARALQAQPGRAQDRMLMVLAALGPRTPTRSPDRTRAR